MKSHLHKVIFSPPIFTLCRLKTFMVPLVVEVQVINSLNFAIGVHEMTCEVVWRPVAAVLMSSFYNLSLNYMDLIFNS